MNAPARLAMTEFDLQIFTVQLLSLTAAPGVVWFAIPNGEARSPRTGARLKRMGVKRGVGDLCLILPGAGTAAFLELKSAKGRTSPEQRAFRDLIEGAGGRYALANTIEGVTAILQEWNAIK